jgi:hypothetical protein
MYFEILRSTRERLLSLILAIENTNKAYGSAARIKKYGE